VKRLEVRHNLSLLMAKNHIKSIKELTRKMEGKYGYEYATLYNFSVYIHKKLDPTLVADFCEFFNCSIDDLLYLEEDIEKIKRA
jgi:hypothetical protein